MKFDCWVSMSFHFIHEDKTTLEIFHLYEVGDVSLSCVLSCDRITL